VNSLDTDIPEVELQSLEARVLYDASPLIAVAGESLGEAAAELDIDEIHDLTFDDAATSDAFALEDEACDECATIDDALLDSPVSVETASRQLIVVDQRIEGHETLVSDIYANGDSAAYDVLLVRPEENGFERVSEYLNGMANYGAVHIFGHQNDGQIELGSETLSSDSFQDYEATLESWNQGLDAEAEILLHGPAGGCSDFGDSSG